jgi:hypothetical protein
LQRHLLKKRGKKLSQNGKKFMDNKIIGMRIEKVWFDANNIYIVVDSGHTIGNPLAWFSRLANASEEQRNNYELGPFGESIHWPELDEDLALESFFDFKRELHYAKI